MSGLNTLGALVLACLVTSEESSHVVSTLIVLITVLAGSVVLGALLWPF